MLSCAVAFLGQGEGGHPAPEHLFEKGWPFTLMNAVFLQNSKPCKKQPPPLPPFKISLGCQNADPPRLPRGLGTQLVLEEERDCRIWQQRNCVGHRAWRCGWSPKVIEFIYGRHFWRMGWGWNFLDWYWPWKLVYPFDLIRTRDVMWNLGVGEVEGIKFVGRCRKWNYHLWSQSQ